jgi:hypothetical protein
LERAADEYVQATEQLKDAREKLITEIRSAHASGVRPADILRAVKHVWTREYLRKLLGGKNGNGAPPQ